MTDFVEEINLLVSHNITQIDHVIIGDYPYSQIEALSRDCQDSCNNDCNCWAARYADKLAISTLHQFCMQL